jgi:isoaspartyl peptidase/L-asparaginase-like protein (Ntn-hydrolase superfamily)
VTEPVIIASERGEVGLPAGMRVLRAGGSALDAVEAAVRDVEANADDHYVGVGGLPNLLGVVELDAGIMDGTERRAGAVGAVTGFPHPVSIARAVRDRLAQHVLLVGEGAERFGDEAGVERGETLTAEAKELWRAGLGEQGVTDAGRWGSEGEIRYRREALARLQALDPAALAEHPWGTVNVQALDRDGHLAVAVSTSGYPWKYPGRLGDTPVVGAGFYVDDRFGGATCTGRGELTIRATTAREVLHHLERGLDAAEACAAALRETAELADDYRAPVQALCLRPDGSHGGASTRADATYSVLTGGDDEIRFLDRVRA